LEWLLRLDGDAPLTTQETAALREWMARSPSHREELAGIARIWNQANVLTELAVPLRAESSRVAGAHGAKFRWAAAMAAVVIVAGVVAWRAERTDGVTNGTYATAVGQQETLRMTDGSSVQLNTDSQMQVIYSKERRQIRLLRGEALFSVAPDPRRPFEVQAANSIARAVGTAFSMRLEGSMVDVTVTQGTVDVDEIETAATLATDRVDTSETPLRRLGRLRAGQSATLASGTDHIEVLQLDEPELQRRMAWQQGYLVFADAPLSEVVAQVNRYSPVTLIIADPHLQSVNIGGRFRIGDLKGVLNVLHTYFGIQAQQVDARSIRLERQGGPVPR